MVGAAEDGGEGLVELEEVDVAEARAGALEQRRHDLEGALAHVLAVDADVVPRAQHGDRLETELGGAGREGLRDRAGNLLGKSASVTGVASQQRTPIMTDVRVRGSHVGDRRP